MIRKYSKQLLLTVLFTGIGTPAYACNLCTLAFFDYYLPPVFIWQLFPIIWFLALCIVRRKDDLYVWGIPRLVFGLLIGLGTIVIGNAVGFGPLLSLLLLIPCVILALATISKKIRQAWGPNQSKKYVGISVIGTISLFCLLGLSVSIQINRTPGEYVAEWGLYGPGRSIVNQLKINSTSDLDDIRLIVSESNTYASTELAHTLAKIGDPTIDFPILLNALKRTRQSSGNYGEDDIEFALKVITGLKLESKTSVEDWEKAFRNKNFTESAEKADEMASLAIQEDAESQISQSKIHFWGDHVEQDDPKIAEHTFEELTSLAEQGDAAAQCYLGIVYLRGSGVKKDYGKPFSWLLQYLRGSGVKKDYIMASTWISQAAEQGNIRCQYILGYMYSGGGYGVVQNHQEAARWFKMAAEKGNANAQYAMGLGYELGLGVIRDVAAAAKWYTKAAEQEQRDAQYYLGLLYYHGEGVPQDEKEGIKWLKRAYTNGHSGAKDALVHYCNEKPDVCD